MRLWSLHPSYLDSKGLVALWREALLARKVLQGRTRGYRHHPQLERFKAHARPQAAIASYLDEVYREAVRRGYSFDIRKAGNARTRRKIRVTSGQLKYEMLWLERKLKKRDPAWLKGRRQNRPYKQHPLFRIVPGRAASWEKIRK